MRTDKPRIEPLHESTWNEEQQDAFKALLEQGNVLNIFRTLSNHPKLAKRWMVFANHILGKSTLSVRDREIAILRIGWLCKAEYEWGQHVVIAKRAGMTDEEIENIKTGADAPGWAEHERLLIKATDELHNDAFVSDETWAGLSKTYSTEQIMDIVFTVGQYNLVSWALNSFGVQLDKGIPGF
ncbi:MAG: carboxymuconolactone decarboxylase family protein [Pseudomonadales bacterium]|nr:carboxymuconolactone decarboxylase family protein [Pseudomonadales bacterium]